MRHGELDVTRHRSAIEAVLREVNDPAGKDEYVLKGGTALSLLHGLDRFSEDIDLDALSCDIEHSHLEAAVEAVCEREGWTFRLSKDTQTTQRFFMNYGSPATPLKIEASYRNARVREDLYEKREGICAYTLDALAGMKASAYLARDKVRDLYDVAWLASERLDDLAPSACDALRRALEYKDLEQFDYLMRTQDDPLVDTALLEERFLESFSRLGLLDDGPELEMGR